MVKMNEVKLDGQSKDVVSENISILKELFPEVMTENKIAFEKLQSILGKEIDDSHEKYSFTWPGKTQAIKESQKQSTGTLRPYHEESKNWDTTQNLYIEGDNLEVLKLLQKGYYNKIKCIYIDPPYNTGNEFIYKDDFKDNTLNYLKLTGQLFEDDENINIKLSNNAETDGRYHSNWLNMMYPRLKLAKYLLKDDGVIFISIDDNEVLNLLEICNEIFGEDYVDLMIWRKSGIGRDGKMKNTTTFRKDHEYVVVCFNRQLKLNKSFEKPQWERQYGNPDNDYRGNYKAGSISRTEKASKSTHKNYYTVTSPSGKTFTRQFDVPFDKFKELDNDNRIYWGKNGDSVPALKIFENEKRSVTTSSLIFEENVIFIDDKNCTTTKGSKELEEILNVPDLGSEMRPKPLNLIKKFIQIGADDGDIILDFFSGTSTTFNAIMEFNYENNVHIKSIMVQIPVRVDEKSKAYKAGYKTICEIGKERIRRAGDKILKESQNKDLDIGFKVFKLDSSNLEKWDPDYKNIQQSLTINNIKEDRTNNDLIYEIMLKYGIDLTLPIEQNDNIYSIGFGALVICLDNNLTKEITSEILNFTKDASTSRVVFKDSGFASDADKTNIKEILKTNNIDEFITI